MPPGSQTPLAIGEYLSGTSTGLTTPNLSYKLLFSEIVAQSGSAACQDRGDCLVVNAGPVLNLINTHFSGLFFGLAGTVLAPVIQLGRSFTAIGDFIKAGDGVAAINEFINIPANVTNAFLNGSGYLDRTAAVGMLIPGGLPVDSIGVEIGGLLSSTPYNGSLTDPSNPPTKWTGGVGFDGVTTTTGSTTLRGLKFGFLGSVVGMGQFLSDKLLIPSPQAGQAVAPAPVKSAAAAPAAAAPAAAPVVAEAPAPAVVEAPAAPAAIDFPAAVEAPAAAPAQAVAEAPAHRDGGGNNKSDNGSPAKGHRGAPPSRGSH